MGVSSAKRPRATPAGLHPDDVSLERLLERQAGVVTLGQAVSCGLSADTVRRRVREGRWTQLHPTVHLVGGHRLTGEARIWAAWLYAGGRSTVSGPAAAFRHGMLREPPDVVDVTVPAALNRRARSGVRWHRHDLLPVDRAGIGTLWLTAPALTALETALALTDGSTFLDRALQRHVRFPTLYRAYCRHVGRAGWARGRELICASADRADSAAERLLVRILRDGGVTGWVLGYPFGPWTIDLAFPEQKVAVEVDGWAWHVDADRFRNDRRKQNALVRAGWDPLRFTWHDVDGRPGAVLSEVRDTVEAAA
jgi:very-short-patch-repair endonuclease